MIRLVFIALFIPVLTFALPIKPGEKFRIQIPGEYIVKTKLAQNLLSGLKKELGPNLYLVQAKNPKKLLKISEAIYPNYMYFGDYKESNSVPNDIDFLKQFHHQMIQTTKAWEITRGSPEVIVAVTDNEFQIDHLDLKTAWWKNKNEIPDNGIDDDNNGYIDDVVGWDFLTNDNNTDSLEEFTHGTHVSGIIASTLNNQIGGTGIAPNVKVMPLRWFGEEGRWTSAIIVETYQYAIKMGAKIITTSYYIDHLISDQAYLDTVQDIKNNDILLFNSAGNNNIHNPPRQQIEDIILVCSVSSKEKKGQDIKSKFSNYGSGIDICAPGNPVYSTFQAYSGVQNRYGYHSGTSMAAPAAAAVAALIWSAHPNLSAIEVREKLFETADNIDDKNSKFIGKLGAGRVNAFKAVR